MNLGAWRQYHEANLINFFALSTPTGSKGTIVSITGAPFATGYNPVLPDDYGSTSLANGTPNVYSNRYESNARVTATSVGGVPLGMQLYDVLEVNPWGESLIYREVERAERQIVLSGQNVPIATRGFFYVLGASGGAAISGSCPAIARNGQICGIPAIPTGANGLPTETQIGVFLGTTGRDGGAHFYLNL